MPRHVMVRIYVLRQHELLKEEDEHTWSCTFHGIW